jgi:hypothetical protein
MTAARESHVFRWCSEELDRTHLRSLPVGWPLSSGGPAATYNSCKISQSERIHRRNRIDTTHAYSNLSNQGLFKMFWRYARLGMHL